MKNSNQPLPDDLSVFDHPFASVFDQPGCAEEWEPYVLTAEQINFFNEKGFINGIKILTEEQVNLLNEELVQLQSLDEKKRALFYHYESNESVDPDKVLFHAIGAWRITPGFHDLLWAPAFRMAAYQLLGVPFSIFHDQLFCKPAKHGGVVAWHQDFSYWTFTKPMHHLTCWIGLDDATTENGCLCYVPGSHKWGLLPITGLTGDMNAVREILTPEQIDAFDKKVANELHKGYASFHHPLLMHGSYANASQRSRRATVINVMSRHTLGNTAGYYRQEALKTFPPMPQDQLLEGRYFPCLFDEEKEGKDFLNSIPKVDYKNLYSSSAH